LLAGNQRDRRYIWILVTYSCGEYQRVMDANLALPVLLDFECPNPQRRF
jgi:hypothetical protein